MITPLPAPSSPTRLDPGLRRDDVSIGEAGRHKHSVIPAKAGIQTRIGKRDIGPFRFRTKRFALASHLLLAALLLLGAHSAAAQLKADTARLSPHAIEVGARPIASFSRNGNGAFENSRLGWRGGLVLTSPSTYFGGWSGLRLDEDGRRFVAVSDAGLWMTGELAYDARERPKALRAVRLGPLKALNDKPLRRMRDRDAEAIALASGTPASGTAYIAFEQNDRIGIFDIGEQGLGAPRSYLRMPEEKRRMRSDGIEALTVLKGGPRKGALVAFMENRFRGEAAHRGWIWAAGVPRGFTVPGLGDYSITDAASLDDGSVLLLERRFRWLDGLRIRLRHLAADGIRAGAAAAGEVLLEADLSHQIDNMEALAVHRSARGETVITMLSDDNFNGFLQRTVLLQFTLKDTLTDTLTAEAEGTPSKSE